MSFDWEDSIGVPGAFIIKNNHRSQFYLKTVTLEDVPNHGKVHFVCNSWVYPAHRYKYDRVFFANKVFPPSYSKTIMQMIQNSYSGSNSNVLVLVLVGSLLLGFLAHVIHVQGFFLLLSYKF